MPGCQNVTEGNTPLLLLALIRVLTSTMLKATAVTQGSRRKTGQGRVERLDGNGEDVLVRTSLEKLNNDLENDIKPHSYRHIHNYIFSMFKCIIGVINNNILEMHLKDVSAPA